MNAESNGTNPTNAIRLNLSVLHHPAENRRFWPTATTSVREGVHGHLAHRKFHMFPKKNQNLSKYSSFLEIFHQNRGQVE